MHRAFIQIWHKYKLYLCISLTTVLQSSLVFAASPAISPFTPAGAEPIYYGTHLCTSPEYQCITIKHGETWEKLFPNEKDRDLVQRVNRTYNRLAVGQILVVPKQLSSLTLLDLAPFPHHIKDNERQIVVNQDKLAWGAYNEDGDLVKWGPISSGRDKCSDSANSCRTLTGVYRVFSKENAYCSSDVFPIGKGGAKMPFCMYFHKGFALHGADDIPGYRASHGCIRMFVEDAKWLNLNFVETSNEANGHMGTKVVVLPVSAPSTFITRRAAW